MDRFREWVVFASPLVASVVDHVAFRVGKFLPANIPTEHQNNRGAFVRTEGDTGVADQLLFNRKADDDDMDWVDLLTLNEHSHDLIDIVDTSTTQAINIPFGDGGGTPPLGVYLDISLPNSGTFTKWRIEGTKFLSGSTGSVSFGLWKDSYDNFPPVVGDSIVASAPPTLSSAAASESSTLTGWNSTFAAGDVVRVSIDSASTISQGTLTLEWDPITADTQSVVIPIGDGSSVPSTGIYRDFTMSLDGVFVGWRILGTHYFGGATTGSLVVDLWSDAYVNFPPTDADSITASAPPTLSASIKASSTSLTGWSTSFSAGDTFRVNVDSVANLTLGSLVLDYVRA